MYDPFVMKAIYAAAFIYTYEIYLVWFYPQSRCQTYEGGFGGVPGMEAHGGYSFCGLAALMFLNKGHLCNTDALLKWAANRQMRVEGGFQVRASTFNNFKYIVCCN